MIHCVSAESEDPLHDYKVVRKELENYSSVLSTKPEIILVTKSDTKSVKEIEKIKKLLKTKLAVSVIDTDSIDKLNQVLADNFKSVEEPVDPKSIVKLLPREK